MGRIKKKNVRVDTILKRLYYDTSNPAAYSSPRTLYKFAKEIKKDISLKDVTNWLQKQDVYTKFRKRVNKFTRRKVIVRGPCIQGQIDLLFYKNISKENKGYKYLITYIDCFSRWAHAIPIKLKSHATEEFNKHFIKKFPQKIPVKIQSDKGTEFISKSFKSLLKKHNIILFHTEQDVKASIVERFNRTLRELITKYMVHQKTLNYIKVLPQILDVYNNRPHRTLGGYTPNSVTKKNAQFFFDLMYKKYLNQKKKKYKFQINDRVRISSYKKIFDKTEVQNFTNEIFIVVNRKDTNPPTYIIADEKTNEIIVGAFYEPELSLVRKEK